MNQPIQDTHIYPHIRERLATVQQTMGTYSETFISGDGPMNQAMERIREATAEALDLVRLRDRQAQEYHDRSIL